MLVYLLYLVLRCLFLSWKKQVGCFGKKLLQSQGMGTPSHATIWYNSKWVKQVGFQNDRSIPKFHDVQPNLPSTSASYTIENITLFAPITLFSSGKAVKKKGFQPPTPPTKSSLATPPALLGSAREDGMATAATELGVAEQHVAALGTGLHLWSCKGR